MNDDRDTALLNARPRRITAKEFFRMPEGPPYFQLIDGQMIKSSTPNFFH